MSRYTWAGLVCAAALATACVDTGTIGREVPGLGASGTGAAGSGSSGRGGEGGEGGDAGGDGGRGGAMDASSDAPVDVACEPELHELGRPEVDVVWALQTGGNSLQGIFAEIEAHIGPSFADALAASLLDWRLTVVAQRGESADRVCVPEPLAGPGCASAPPRFHAVDCDLGGPDFLSSLGASYGAINPFSCRGSGPIPWSAAVRYDAYKVLVIVADDEPGIPPLFWNATTFDTFLLGASPAGSFGSVVARRFVVHGIVGTDLGNPPARCSSATHTADAPGLEYLKLAQATGGTIASVCNPDWPGTLQGLARAIVARHECDYPLPRRRDAADVVRDAVTVSRGSGSGPLEVVPRDDTTTCDGGAEGWQYNVDESRILLCGATCAAVAGDPDARVEVELGCGAGAR